MLFKRMWGTSGRNIWRNINFLQDDHLPFRPSRHSFHVSQILTGFPRNKHVNSGDWYFLHHSFLFLSQEHNKPSSGPLGHDFDLSSVPYWVLRCFCLQVVLWRVAVGDLHSGRLALPRNPSGGALQAAEGGASDGQTSQLHTWAVGSGVSHWSYLGRPSESEED